MCAVPVMESCITESATHDTTGLLLEAAILNGIIITNNVKMYIFCILPHMCAKVHLSFYVRKYFFYFHIKMRKTVYFFVLFGQLCIFVYASMDFLFVFGVFFLTLRGNLCSRA